MVVAISRLTVVSHEAKEEAARGSLTDSRLARECITGTRVVKIKNVITKEP